jgi:hypothetical protein
MRSSSSSGSAKRFGRISIVLLLVLVALALAAPAAFAHGSIEGTVTASVGGAPLENIHVYAFENGSYLASQVPNLSGAVGSATTDSLGHYSINNIPGGPLATPHLYQVWFKDMFPFNHYVVQWYMGTSPYQAAPVAVTPVPVVDNVATQNIDDALTAACTITGTVTGDLPGGGSGPLGGIDVYVFENAGSHKSEIEAIQNGAAGAPAPAAVTDVNGNYEITQLNPTGGIGPAGYYLYFYDPSKVNAPVWYGGADPWAGPGTALTQPFGTVNMTERDTYLALASSISGAVDGDAGYGDLQYDLEGVTVHVFADPSFLMGTTTTDEFGRYTIGGLPPNAQGYKVKFDVDPPHAYAGEYYTEWWNNHPTGATADFIPIAHGGINIAGIYALLQPKPWLEWIHPESAANDGPNRFATEVTMGGWGSDFITDIWLEQQASPYRVIYAYDWWYEVGSNGEETVHALFNLATPLAPTGMYSLNWSHDDPWGGYQDDTTRDAFWVLSSYVPLPPVTPTPLPAVPVPAVPASPTPAPVVTPTPAPQPVAGDITTVAYAASVKKGKIATLKYRVDEAVLGGTAAVKIQVTNAAGAVVKNITVAAAPMNQDNSVAFKCNFKKGTYKYTVSVANAKNVASAALKVK